MVHLKRSQVRFIEETMAFPNGFGYVLDFSDRTISEFFEDEFAIDFDDAKYSGNGTSKRNRLTTLISLEDSYTVAKVLRALWERREGLLVLRGDVDNQADSGQMKAEFLKIIADVEDDSGSPKSGGIDRYARDRTLDELIGDIERDLRANKPETAIDHLHTYCMKKFAHLLQSRGITCSENDALHARFGKYRKALIAEREIQTFSDRAMKSAISLFDSFNDIRNHHSLAHDNIILDPAEARFVFETVSAVLVFLRAVEAGRYET